MAVIQHSDGSLHQVCKGPCGLEKPVADFTFANGRYRVICKVDVNAERKAKYEANPEPIREQMRAYNARKAKPKRPIVPDGFKRCSTDGEILPVEQFYVKDKATGQLFSWCITHHKERKAKYNKEHAKENRERSINWQKANPDRVSKSRRNARKRRGDEIRERERLAESKPARKAQKAQYRAANKETRAAYNRDWRKNNPDQVNAIASRRRARKLGNGGSHTGLEWRALMARYTWHCISCGKLAPLTFEHIHSLSKGGPDDIGNGQPFCKSCNSKKGPEYDDLRGDPRYGLLYDVRPDLPIGVVDIEMGYLSVPEHARDRTKSDLLTRTEKLCTFHKVMEPLENFRVRDIERSWYYAECREVEVQKQRAKRAVKKNNT